MNPEHGTKQCHHLDVFGIRCTKVPTKVLLSMCVHEHDLDAAVCEEHFPGLESAPDDPRIICGPCMDSGGVEVRPKFFGIEDIPQGAST